MTQISAIASAPSFPAFAGRARLAALPGAASGAPADTAVSSSSPSPDAADAAPASSSASSSAGDQLTTQEQQVLAQLKATDRLVRAHEQAHLSAGGGLVRGAASFTLQTGPDNRSYAVGGEVSIDASPASTPQETIAKAQQIRAAALAPADPSAQDLRVAARASGMASEAQVELAAQQRALAAESRSGDQGGVLFYRDVARGAGQTPGAALDVYA